MFTPILHRGPCPWVGGTVPKVEPTKVIICGSRTFEDYDLLERKMDRYTFWFDVVEVIIGGLGKKIERGGEWEYVGADFHGNQWAEKNWWVRKIFHADWKALGKGAGHVRNVEMAKYASPDGYLVAFWDGSSPGTKHMIQSFKKYNGPDRLRVVRF